MLAFQKHSTIKAALLASSILAGTAAATAQDADAEALEKRVAELEALVGKLLGKLEVQEVAITEQDGRIATAEKTATAAAEKAEQGGGGKKDGFTIGDTHVQYGGYIKTDVIATRNTAGNQAASSSFVRDFFVPSTIPVGGEGSDLALDFSARQTRFFFKTNTKVNDKTIGSLLEFDFNVTDGGDERISNSYVPRVRHAFITYDGWLIGQTWSTFQDVVALPDSLDFVGTTEGTTFARQPMIRYTSGGFQIAVEQPEATITTPTGGRLLSGSDPLPDLAVRYNHKGDWGHLTVAGILRSINLESGNLGLIQDANTLGYGLSLSGKLKVGEKDDFRFMATAGQGIGRYIGLNIVNDAAVDPDSQELETIGTLSGFAAYRHVINEKVRSNIMLSYFSADNPQRLLGSGVTDQVWSLRGNIVYSPVPHLDFGIEYGYSERSLENSIDGGQHRLQFSGKYTF